MKNNELPSNDNGITPVIEFISTRGSETSRSTSSQNGEVIEFTSIKHANPTPNPEPPNLVA
jgi:hypothetical protein